MKPMSLRKDTNASAGDRPISTYGGTEFGIVT